ncbi:MAG: HNH endonuclease signature motif containing protein [bacterium]
MKTEHLTTLEILVHLNEVERRELYLTLGCGSMYDYCVNHLGYSRSAAWRRIHSARCIVRFPEVYALLEKGALNLTTLSMIATALNRENKTELLGRVRGKSQDEVEDVLASYRPPAAFRDRVKPVRVTVPVTGNSETLDSLGLGSGEVPTTADRPRGSAAPAGTPALNRFRSATHSTDGGTEGGSKHGSETAAQQLIASGASVTGASREGDRSGVDNGPAGSVSYIIKKQLLIQFLASEEFMAKYQEARSLLSNTLAELSFEAVFETLLDDYLDRHSPARKQERREKRAVVKKQRKTRAATKKQQEEQFTKAKPTETTGTEYTGRPNRDGSLSGPKHKLSRKKFDEHSRSGSKIILLTSSGDEPNSRQDAVIEHGARPAERNTTPEKTRHIPAKIKDAVYIRDKNRCTHVGTNGRRCESTYRLQIDHIVPFARGGTNALSNLRLLCAKHNKLEAKRAFGAAKIEAHCKRE